MRDPAIAPLAVPAGAHRASSPGITKDLSVFINCSFFYNYFLK